jgi:ketosteroid isomerase-like protein
LTDEYFTFAGSGMSATEVMQVMDTVYSAFDALVEDASAPDGDLWKVDTVREIPGMKMGR